MRMYVHTVLYSTYIRLLTDALDMINPFAITLGEGVMCPLRCNSRELALLPPNRSQKAGRAHPHTPKKIVVVAVAAAAAEARLPQRAVSISATEPEPITGHSRRSCSLYSTRVQEPHEGNVVVRVCLCRRFVLEGP
jgi:hypothetical protein